MRNDDSDDDDNDDSDDDSDDDDDNEDDSNDDYDSDNIPIAQLELASSMEEDEMKKYRDDRVSEIFTGSSSRRASRKINRYINQCRTGQYCRKSREDDRGMCKQRNANGKEFPTTTISMFNKLQGFALREGMTHQMSVTVMATSSLATAGQ